MRVGKGRVLEMMPGKGLAASDSGAPAKFGHMMEPDRAAKETNAQNSMKMDLVLALSHLTLEGTVSRGSIRRAEGIVDGLLGPAANFEIVMNAARDIAELAGPKVAEMLRAKVAAKRGGAASEIDGRYYGKLAVAVERALSGTE